MIWTNVLTAVGDLRALIHVPDKPGPLPGMVLVDGSGDGACDDWGESPTRLMDQGAVVLTHDKPGCGGSPGHWTDQSLTDRAYETLAAVEVLRAHPAVRGQPVGLYGVSQGGWVSLLAASLRPATVDFVIAVSGPGVSPAVQDRYRIEMDLRAVGTPPAALAEALAWLDERSRRLLAGEPVDAVLADQERLADRSWYAITTRYFDSPAMLGFLARNLAFEPVEILPDVRCPVLALFGAADTLVPVADSVTAIVAGLPELPAVAVFPGADHGLFTADPDPDVPRTEQLAAGFLPTVAGFLARAAQQHHQRGGSQADLGGQGPLIPV